MATLAKGLAVLGTFDKAAADDDVVAGGAGDRPVARDRAAHPAHAHRSSAMSSRTGGSSRCRPRILKLGFAYLATQNWIEQAAPLMRQLSEQFHESCSRRFCRAARSSMSRAFRRAASCRSTLAVGTRLPAFHTALGTDPARLSRRSGSLAPAEIAAHRGLHAVDDHRHPGAVRPRARGSRAGILHRRRRARTRPARDRGADRRPRAARRSPRSI